MKTEQQIRLELERQRKTAEEYKGCTIGTDGYTFWKEAATMVACLEWILGE